SGLTLDGSFIPHSNFLVYQNEELEPKTITEVVEIANSKSTPLVPPPKTPPLSTPKPKENLEPNPHQPLILYPYRLKEEIFQALENPTGRADYFVYKIDIVDSWCDKFPIENNSMSGNPTPSSDSVVESLFPSPIPYEDNDPLLEETDILLSHFDNSLLEYETFSFDIEEKSSGSTTTHSDFSLSDYEAFYFDDDHIEKKSSGSTTTHFDFSLHEYDSFIFDLSIDQFPSADRSAFSHEEFADELAYIISPSERGQNDDDVQMADHLRLMKELLRIPIAGIENAIIESAVLADEFELKIELLDFITNNSFFGAAETWLENETPNSIRSWDDLSIQNQMGQMEETFQERPLGVLPSDAETYTREERKAVTTVSGLTLDGSFIPHSNFLVYQDEELEPKTITEVVEIANSKSTPLVPPPKTPPLSTPKPKENLEPNPHQPLILYPYRLKEEIFQALENPTGRADYFVYKIDIVDSWCDKFPIENNSMSGNPTPSSDSVVESLFPSPIPYEDNDPLLEETDILLSHFDNSLLEYETFSFDIEEKSSGSTTTHSDFSLSDYEAFYFD
nr:hypothetical protein [Tanacetum cinerariifolium]